MRKKLNGIYKIINLYNKKIYVGQSRNIMKRWDHHKTDLRKGTHHNPHLQSAWNKYGKDLFKLEIIEHNDTYTELNRLERETFFIQSLKSNYSDYGYNVILDNNEGARRKKKYFKKAKRRVYQLSKMDGFIIKLWDSITDIVLNLAYSRNKLIDNCNGVSFSYKGSIWVYEDKYKDFVFKPLVFNLGVKTYKQKKFINFKTGEIIYHHSIKEVAEQLGISYWCFTKEINLGFIYKDWGFDYCTEKPKMPRINKALKNVDVKNVSTGEVFNFSSIKKFITFAKISHTRFSIAKRNKSFPFTYGEWEILNISS